MERAQTGSFHTEIGLPASLDVLQVNKEFLFSASSPGSYGDDSDARQGLALSHAYSILKAVDLKDEQGNEHRLVLIR